MRWRGEGEKRGQGERREGKRTCDSRVEVVELVVREATVEERLEVAGILAHGHRVVKDRFAELSLFAVGIP